MTGPLKYSAGNEPPLLPLLSDEADRRSIEIEYLRRMVALAGTMQGKALAEASLSLEVDARTIELALAGRLELIANRTKGDPGWLIDFLSSEDSGEIFPDLEQSDEPVKRRKFADLLARRQAKR